MRHEARYINISSASKERHCSDSLMNYDAGDAYQELRSEVKIQEPGFNLCILEIFSKSSSGPRCPLCRTHRFCAHREVTILVTLLTCRSFKLAISLLMASTSRMRRQNSLNKTKPSLTPQVEHWSVSPSRRLCWNCDEEN